MAILPKSRLSERSQSSSSTHIEDHPRSTTMHNPIDIRILLVNVELKIYCSGWGSVNEFDVFHDVFVEAVEVFGFGD
jgi:hypothetical protein